MQLEHKIGTQPMSAASCNNHRGFNQWMTTIFYVQLALRLASQSAEVANKAGTEWRRTALSANNLVGTDDPSNPFGYILYAFWVQ